MSDARISDLSDGGSLQSSDLFVIARSGQNYKIDKSKVLGPVLIFDSLLGSDAASIDSGASSIPSGFSAIQILLQLRTAAAGAVDNALFRLNNDSGANYYGEDMLANNTTLTGENALGLTSMTVIAHGSGGSASYASTVRMLIPSYDKTNFYKTVEFTEISNDDTAGNNYYRAHGMTWKSTSAITRASVAGNGVNLKTGSRMIIHGLP